MTIGDRIKKLRTEMNMTQEQLANYIGTTKQTIYKYENNIVTNIPSDKIEGLAHALKTTPAYLMGWSDKIDADYNISTRLIDTHYRGILIWSEDKLLKKHEVSIIRGHITELFLRYKQLIKKYVFAQRRWDKDKESFSKFYKERSEPLTDAEIKKLYLKQELEPYMKKLSDWVYALPSWVINEEQKFFNEQNKNKGNTSLFHPNAAHEIDGASEEDKVHDEVIMDDEDF